MWLSAVGRGMKKVEKHCARAASCEKRKKTPLISYVTGKRKSSKKPDLLITLEAYYVINDCDVRRSVSVANLNAKEKKVFCDQQPGEENNTAEQSDELQQLYCTYMKTILTMQVYVFVTVILSHVANAIAYFDTEC